MKRTTIFLTDELESLLEEAARRSHRPQAEIVREALTQYLRAQPRPWPRSVGMGESSDQSVTSENVKEWVQARWRQEMEDTDAAQDDRTTC